MPRKILEAQRKKFWRLRNAGHTIEEASIRAGFSKSYGKGLSRNGIGVTSSGNETIAKVAQADIEEIRYRPKQPDELSDVARDCLSDFARFRARYLGSVTMPWQEEAANEVVERLDAEDNSYGVINAPQGSGKTRLFSHDIPAWVTVRDRSIRGLLGAFKMGVSQSMTAGLQATLARTSPALASLRWKARGMERDAEACLVEDYGRFKPIMPGVQWRRESFEVEQHWVDEDTYGGTSQRKEPTWAAFSYEAGTLSWRVDFMNWDDLVTTEMLRNEESIRKLYSWWDVEAESRLDPGGLCLVTMQRLGGNDVSKYLLDKIDPEFEIDADQPGQGPKQYFHVVYKAHYPDRCQGQHTKDAPAYPEGCMLDPKRITWQMIRAKQVAGIYEIVYQQEDKDPATQLVREAWINGGHDPHDNVSYVGCRDHDRAPGELPLTRGTSVRYITVDPSATNYWSVQDWIYQPPPDGDQTAGLRHLVDIRRQRMQAPELLDWSHNQQTWTGLLEEWWQRAKDQGRPIGWVIMERNAAQRWAMQYEHFRRWQQARSVSVIPHETMRNKTDPKLGVEATLPGIYRYGRVRLPSRRTPDSRHVEQLVTEVTNWPDLVTTDCAMAQWIGEYHLPTLVSTTMTIGSLTRDIPSWVRGAA